MLHPNEWGWRTGAAALLVCALHAHAAAAPRGTLEGKVNLNSATLAELDLLPGVGLAMAERIVAHRRQSPFRKPEELVRVRGVGRKKYLRLAPYLAVDGPTTLTLREAPQRPRGKLKGGPGPPLRT